ncbi:MAG: anthranilate synthase component I family protein [Cytophagales bacterium]|nr:anthranilate synthase component I family protein [Cytophagales bacterium]
MKQYPFKTHYKKLLSDTLTPVSIYLKLRDKYAQSILLESSDYHGNDNSFSYICCDPIASFEVENGILHLSWPDGSSSKKPVDRDILVRELQEFSQSFKADEALEFKFTTNGLFGYLCYDGVKYFEDIDLANKNAEIADAVYKVYRHVIVIDHFKNELYLFEHLLEGETGSNLERVEALVKVNSDPQFTFTQSGQELSNYTDEQFLEIIEKGRSHCLRGDVFQVVLSRRFQSKFKGDEFNVYRALRSINPSPYLFYFDYGSYKLFGSSPESQIVIKNGEAIIYPIAGTFRRTGNDTADAELAQKLSEDEKENSEHVMLVDLARNDLSRNSEEVAVEVFKEIQYYSHVIHLVSKVTGKLAAEANPIQLVADTFPAGTLSGAPKHMAMQLIDKYENASRSYYGGAIGFLGFDGDFNHAIMIRSFLSKDNTLSYQAGAGVVAKSVVENELQEVNNKLAALRSALKMAEEI